MADLGTDTEKVEDVEVDKEVGSDSDREVKIDLGREEAGGWRS